MCGHCGVGSSSGGRSKRLAVREDPGGGNLRQCHWTLWRHRVYLADPEDQDGGQDLLRGVTWNCLRVREFGWLVYKGGWLVCGCLKR